MTVGAPALDPPPSPPGSPAPPRVAGWRVRLRRPGAGADLPRAYRQHHFLMLAVVVAAIAALAPELATSRSLQFRVNLWLAYTIAVVGFYWVFGLAGKFAFCQTFMMLVGGYTSAWATRPDGGDLPVVAGIALAMAVTMALAGTVGFAIRRSQAFYFGIATLCLSQVGAVVFRQWTGFTGLNGTTTGVAPLELGGTRYLQEDEVFRVLVVVVAVVLALAALLERSALKRDAVAGRARPQVAAALGIPVARNQTVLFALGSGLGGLSGALIAHWNGVIAVNSFGMDLSIGIFLMLLLGGAGSMWGPLLGTAFYVAAPEVLESVEGWSQVVYGAVLLAVVIGLPGGFAGVIRSGVDRLGPVVRRPGRQPGPESGAEAPGEARRAGG